MAFCGACGARLSPGERFCGGCGAQVPGTAPPPVAAPPAVSTTPTASRSGELGYAMLGVAAAVMIFSLGLYFWMRAAPEAGDDGEPSTDETQASTRGPGSGPSPSGPSSSAPARPLPRGATEVDRPGTFAYVGDPPSCAAETQVTDELKKLGLNIDEQMRKGSQLTTAEEADLGRTVLDAFEKEVGGRLLRSGPEVAYLTAVAKPLLERAQRKDLDYTFYFWVDTKIVNAFALPGGHIAVSKPLWDQWFKNEAQLATVLGHEIGHADLRHPVAVFETLRASGLPFDDAATRMLVMLARLPYSTAFEENADHFGAEAMHQAGYSVFQAVAMWDKVARDAGDVNPKRKPQDPLEQLAEAAMDELKNLGASHPAPARRACLLRQTADELFTASPRDEVYVGTTNLSRKVPMTERVY